MTITLLKGDCRAKLPPLEKPDKFRAMREVWQAMIDAALEEK